ncbi:cytidine deaminase [soil metagenome]|nr:cytidine deaminase [Actinomycetota bacterium]MDQ3218609.1 cytidine deaminase [Actinomycetota bacterium]
MPETNERSAGGSRQEEIDWGELRAAAIEASDRAYAPYSHFPVGAAGLVDDGRILSACNVENASYGLGLCAECGLVSALHGSGGGRLVAVVCVDGRGEALMPCGRCRQLLLEAGGEELLVQSSDGPLKLAELLPRSFSSADLEQRS